MKNSKKKKSKCSKCEFDGSLYITVGGLSPCVNCKYLEKEDNFEKKERR